MDSNHLQRNIWLLTFLNFFEDFKPYYIIAILYFVDIAGSNALGMMVYSFIMVSSAIFEVPTGIISDLAGRKKTILFGSIAATVAIILFAMAHSIWILLLGAVFQGLSRSFYSGNNDALLHDTLKEQGEIQKYPILLGRTRSMFQLALATSAIVGTLMSTGSFRFIMWVSVVPQIICILLSFFFVEPRAHSSESTNIFAHMKEAFSLFLKNSTLRLHSIGSIWWQGLGELIFYFEPVFISTLWPVWGIGIARVLDHSFGWMSYWFAGRFINKKGVLTALISALLLTSILGLAAFGFPTVLSPILLAFTAIPYGVIIVSQSTLLQKEFSEKQRATMGSLNSLFGSLFFGICAVVLGWIGDVWNPVTAMLSAQIALLALLPLYWSMSRSKLSPIR